MLDSLNSPFTTIVVAVVLVALLCARQLRTRPLREERGIRLFAVLSIVGLGLAADDLHAHAVGAPALALAAGSLAVALALGVVRGRLVHVWRQDGQLLRRGNGWTVALWFVSIAAHVGAGFAIAALQPSAAGLGDATLLLTIALALGAQRVVTLQRGRTLAPASAPLAEV